MKNVIYRHKWVKSKNSCSVFWAHTTHTTFFCFGSHLNVHWIRPQTHWFIDTCCIWILQKSKHCRSITLSKCLLTTLDGLPSKRFFCQLVLWCVSYHHFLLLCVSIINAQVLAKRDPLRQTDDSFLFTVSFEWHGRKKCHHLGAFLWTNVQLHTPYHCKNSQVWQC